jgi:hypothetical protein
MVDQIMRRHKVAAEAGLDGRDMVFNGRTCLTGSDRRSLTLFYLRKGGSRTELEQVECARRMPEVGGAGEPAGAHDERLPFTSWTYKQVQPLTRVNRVLKCSKLPAGLDDFRVRLHLC